MKAIKAYRRRSGLGQRELAEEIGVTRLTIARYESGARTPDVYTLKKIADRLGCKIDDLVDEAAAAGPDVGPSKESCVS